MKKLIKKMKEDLSSDEENPNHYMDKKRLNVSKIIILLKNFLYQKLN